MTKWKYAVLKSGNDPDSTWRENVCLLNLQNVLLFYKIVCKCEKLDSILVVYQEVIRMLRETW